ncbi:MAG: ssl1498 family light-harvesting-like protein [Nostocaceae cyanobacterium]|nr:ssl1498 family light-harvesting-like protein [Nostocaceae cyanobacterium]
MYTTTDERGIMNNFAREPQVYYAKDPSPEEQNRYKFFGVVAAVFVSVIVLVAFTVS